MALFNLKKLKRVTKSLAKSKTVIFSLLIGLFGVIKDELSNFETLFSDPKFFSAFCIFVSVSTFLLRVVTTGSLMDKVREETKQELPNDK